MIKLQIGTIERDYNVYQTTAPQAFDGFGTLQVYAGRAGDRVVLIQREHESWQTMRYASGLHIAKPLPSAEQYAQDKLIERLSTPPTVDG